MSCKYQKKELRQHIYDTPDTYAGGSDVIEEQLPVLQGDTIVTKSIQYVPALYNIFNEILVNARDQIIRLEQVKDEYPVTMLKITMDRNTGEISIYNDGSGIDVDIHPTEKDEGGKSLMIPEMIFGYLLTSVNYDKDEIWDRCYSIIKEASENRAVLNVLWHQESFSESDFPFYTEIYKRIIETSFEADAKIITLGELSESILVR